MRSGNDELIAFLDLEVPSKDLTTIIFIFQKLIMFIVPEYDIKLLPPEPRLPE